MLTFVLSTVNASSRSPFRKSVSPPVDEDLEQQADLADNLDGDNDGTISPEEMRANLKYLSIHLDILRTRLELEWAMSQMIVKLPNFFMCMICFLTGLYTLSPAASISVANTQLGAHFRLSSENLGKVRNLDQVYDLIQNISDKNQQLMPLSEEYWCESRYFEESYDFALGVPIKRCPSPRLYAVGTKDETDDYPSWSELHPNGVDPSDLEPVSDTCFDNITRLRLEVGNASVVCSDNPQAFCDTHVGVLGCARTCGFCSPFTYKRTNQFRLPQFAVVPIVVYQSRMKKVPCDGFASVFLEQPYNEALVKMPALDGERDDDIVSCVDPTSTLDDDFAQEIPCPEALESVDSPRCKDGKFLFSGKASLFGETVYPKMLSDTQVDALEAVDWLDIQTKSVVASAFVYTEMDELFSSVSVRFDVDRGGKVRASKQILCFRDLIGSSRTIFLGSMVGSIFFGIMGVVYPMLQMINHRSCHNVAILYEVVSRSLLIVYCALILFLWLRQSDMGELYSNLMRQLLRYEGDTSAEFNQLMQAYFAALEEIEERTSLFLNFRIVAYMLLYLQFVQLMLYFAFHPRMGVLTATVGKASSALAHFFALFGMLFLMLAFMAHWMLGTHIEEFETFGDTVASQARMLFGEFIYAGSADEIKGSMLMMYWIYAFTFMLVVFFLLLNFFLAIIVDSFAAVKQDERTNLTEKDFINDFLDSPLSWFVYSMHGWPSKIDIIRKIQMWQNEKKRREATGGLQDLEKTEALLLGQEESEEIQKCSAALFASIVPEFKDKRVLSKFLTYYFIKIPVILSKTKKRINIFDTNAGREKTCSAEDLGMQCAQSSFDNEDGEVIQSIPQGPSWQEYLQHALELSPHLMDEDGPVENGAIDWDIEALALARRIMKGVQHWREQQAEFTLATGNSSKNLDKISVAQEAEPTLLDRMEVLSPTAASIVPPRRELQMKSGPGDLQRVRECAGLLDRFSAIVETMEKEREAVDKYDPSFFSAVYSEGFASTSKPQSEEEPLCDESSLSPSPTTVRTNRRSATGASSRASTNTDVLIGAGGSPASEAETPMQSDILADLSQRFSMSQASKSKMSSSTLIKSSSTLCGEAADYKPSGESKQPDGSTSTARFMSQEIPSPGLRTAPEFPTDTEDSEELPQAALRAGI